MWIWQISEGRLLTPAGSPFALGYSGAPGAVNDPSKISEPDIGPIPIGLWDIGDPIDDPETGPFSLPLTPKPGTETYGRFGFFMHGDSVLLAGLQRASKGCPVVGRFAREAIGHSGDRELSVVATAPENP